MNDDESMPYGGPYTAGGVPQGTQMPGLSDDEHHNRPGGSHVTVIVVALALLLACAYLFFVKIPQVRSAGDQATELEKIRREYLERNAFAVGVVDPGRYGEERRSLFKWYKNRLTELENKYPGSVVPDRFEKELKKKGQREKEQYTKRYDQVKHVWELIDSGRYLPEFSALDSGIRFDIYRLEPVMSGGEAMVRMHFALYGIQRRWLEEQTNTGGHIFRMQTNLKFDQFKVDGRDSAGKQKFEMSIAGGEPFNVNYPERFIAEFPPATILGYYEIPRIPEADVVEMTFVIGTRSAVSGLESMGTFKWKMTEMPKDLKMPSGQEWKNAETRIVESDQ